jgi:hypothetical protein
MPGIRAYRLSLPSAVPFVSDGDIAFDSIGNCKRHRSLCRPVLFGARLCFRKGEDAITVRLREVVCHNELAVGRGQVLNGVFRVPLVASYDPSTGPADAPPVAKMSPGSMSLKYGLTLALRRLRAVLVSRFESRTLRGMT